MQFNVHYIRKSVIRECGFLFLTYVLLLLKCFVRGQQAPRSDRTAPY
jgi:hypothetical protein